MTKPVRVWGWAETTGAGVTVLNIGLIAESQIVEHSPEWSTIHAVLAILMAFVVTYSVRSRRRLRAVQQQQINDAIEQYDRGERE